ncbi:hypothetical protein GF413_02105 [Candidatus Micrarchaeota archaeon]|nr:hypothetical protein [Candidatus Micrarchaeota archaeon]
MGKDDDNYIDNGLYVDDCHWECGPECDLFDGPRKETDYFTELFLDEEFENEICCLN